MTRDEIMTLFDYDRWATGKLLDVLEGIPEDVYRKNPGSSHGGIHGTLVHLVGACDVWLRRWQGETPTRQWKEEDFESFPVLRQQWDSYQSRISVFLNDITDERLNSPLFYKDMKGNPYSTALWKQMQHLVNHGSYHRGQIVTLLRILGMKAVSTDLIYYHKEKEPYA
jgi:uncharacterized damage-inducible protein DinB